MIQTINISEKFDLMFNFGYQKTVDRLRELKALLQQNDFAFNTAQGLG